MTRLTEVDTEAFREYEARGWESGKAEPYSHFFSRVSDRFIEPLLDAARIAAGMRVLDIGCGPGNVAARAAERGADVVGGDFSQQMLAVARRLYPDIEFVQENAERLTFADAAFDAVVGNLVLLHLPQPEAGVAEMVRVLRPGGGLALTVWDAAERSRFTGIFLDAVAAAGASAPAGFPTGPSPVLYADDAKFARLLASAGLGDVVVERVSAESRYDDADELWEGFLASSVRIAALIHGQSTEIRAAIRREFDRLADEAISDGAIRLPAVVCLASGTKGSA